MPVKRVLLITSALCLVSTGARAQAETGTSTGLAAENERHLSLGIGASDWSGDYGASSDTNIAATLLTAQYRAGALRLSASLPWMRIESAGPVFAGVDGTPLVVAPHNGTARTIRNGVGDLSLGAAYLFPDRGLGIDVDTFVRVKVPTASTDSGLSTGKVDYTFGAEISHPPGRFVPFLAVRYRVFGHGPGLALRDGAASSVGGSYVFPNRLAATLSYDYARSASRFVDDSHELVGSLSSPLGHGGLRLSGYASAGLSSGAADISGGLSLSLRI